MISKLSKVAGACYALKNLLPLEAAFSYYNSMAFSLISYMIVIWGNSYNIHLNNLQTVQNKIVRNLFQRFYPDLHTNDLYKTLNILNVRQIYKLRLVNFMFNTLFNNKYKKFKVTLDDFHGLTIVIRGK